VLLGFGIAGSGGLPVVAPVVSLGAFLVGSAAGGVLAARTADRHAEHVARTLAIEVGLVLAAALVAAAADVRPSTLSGDAVIALLALAMGVRNATVRRIAVPDLTTTVLTMTLTGLAADSPLAGGSGKGSVRRITAVLAMLAGALTGALLLKISLVPPSRSSWRWRMCRSLAGRCDSRYVAASPDDRCPGTGRSSTNSSPARSGSR
jgi:uncharacterized membrane protein YoaK (UPF0700 family)